MEPDGWHCRREKYALHATLTAAGNARIAAVQGALMPQGIPPLPNDGMRIANVESFRMKGAAVDILPAIVQVLRLQYVIRSS
jgi:hypothetical protein